MAEGVFCERARRLSLTTLLLMAACAGPLRPVQGPEVPLPDAPPGTGSTAGDPGRGAVLAASYAFTQPARLRGNPAGAARAVAQLEWMAASLPFDPYWISASPMAFQQLALARDEVRAALGLALDAPPHLLAAALGRAAMALDRNNRAAAADALAPFAPGGGAGVLTGLDALPRLPRAAEATSFAEREMMRLAQDDPLS